MSARRNLGCYMLHSRSFASHTTAADRTTGLQPAFKSAEGSKLVAVMSRTPGKAQGFAQRNGIQKAFESIEHVLHDEDIDAIYLATPPGTHLEIAKKIAAAGKPCLIEKPMARNADESKKIAEAFQCAKLPLFVAYSSRFFERTAKVKELLDKAAIGELTAVTYRFGSTPGVRGLASGELPWRLRAEQSGGGLLMDVGCHLLDRIDMLCGPLTDVHGTATNAASPTQAVEDTVVMTARLQRSGALFSAAWAFAGAEGLDELKFIGTAGSITMAGMGPAGPIKVQLHRPDADANPAQDSEFVTEELIQFQPPPSPYFPLVEAVSAQLAQWRAASQSSNRAEAYAQWLQVEQAAENQSGGPPAPSVSSAVRTAEVLDAALGAYYGGRGDAFWTREGSWPGVKATASKQ